MSRAGRLLDLLQALRRHRRPVTAATLAAETGVSVRTLYRDIATLMEQGAPIAGEGGLGYVLGPGYLLPPLAFTRNEADAVLLGLRFVEGRTDDDLAEAAREALAKIVAVLPRAMEDMAATSALLVPARSGEGPPHLALIRQAIRAERKLRLSYVDKKGRPSKRIVWPIVVGFFEGAEMLGAWCETRHDFRHFRLDRIVEAEATDARLPRRHPVLLAEWRLATDLD